MSPKSFAEHRSEMVSQLMPELIELGERSKTPGKHELAPAEKLSAVTWFILSFIIVYGVWILLQQLVEVPGFSAKRLQMIHHDDIDNGQAKP